MSELQVVCISLMEHKLLSFIKSLHTNAVLLVQLCLLHWHHLGLGIIFVVAELLGLIGMHHVVLEEFDHDKLLKLGHSVLVSLVEGGLVVNGRQKVAFLEVLVVPSKTSEVASRADVVLDYIIVNNIVGDVVDNLSLSAVVSVW